MGNKEREEEDTCGFRVMCFIAGPSRTKAHFLNTYTRRHAHSLGYYDEGPLSEHLFPTLILNFYFVNFILFSCISLYRTSYEGWDGSLTKLSEFRSMVLRYPNFEYSIKVRIFADIRI